MALSHLNTIQIDRYKTPNDVPYIRDLSTPGSRGAQGTVWRATTTSFLDLFRTNNAEFAIKEIHVIDKASDDRVLREINHLKACNHSNLLDLVAVYRIEEEVWGDVIFLVTKPWAPLTLHTFLKDLARAAEDKDGLSGLHPWYTHLGTGPWEDIVRGCALGVEHLHLISIRHKDLKPENILLFIENSKNDTKSRLRVRPIIADFGISKEWVQGAKTTFNGTRQYLAPEQLQQLESTPKSDIFSLGCCYAMIQAVISGGQRAVLELEETAFEFATRITEVLEVLQSHSRMNASAKMDDGWHFRLMLALLVQDMLKVYPNERLDIRGVMDRITAYDNNSHGRRSQFILSRTYGADDATSSLGILEADLGF